MRITRFVAAALLSLSVLPMAAFAGNTSVDASGQGTPSTPAKIEQTAKVEKAEKTEKAEHRVKAEHAKVEKTEKAEKAEAKTAVPAEAVK